MKFQGTLLPAGVSDASDVRFRLTPQTTVLAERLLQAVLAAGFAARSEIDLSYDDVEESDESDPVREDAYREVVVETPGEPTLSVCDGGVFVTTDNSRHDEGQGEYATLLRLVMIAEQVSGWRLADRESLLAEAAYYGVGPDGSILEPATLSENELTTAAAALCDRISDTPDRPRPVELLTSATLTAIVAQLDSSLSSLDRPAMFTYHPSDTGYGTRWSPQNDATKFAKARVAETCRPERLYTELGSDETGRSTRVVITLPAERAPDVATRFDSLPPSDFPGSPPLGWEQTIVDMSRRNPQWVPPWIPEALTLLRRAGRNV